jgi:anti-anti-sigma regulatory factor
MLDISVEQETTAGGHGVAVLGLAGELDAASYLSVIERARELVEAGAERILLDLRELSYMGSSGIFALHSIAMLLQGESPPDPEQGWAAMHDAGPSTDVVGQLRLLDPQPQVDRVLERTGMKRFFEVYPDRAAALAAF